MNNFTTKTKGYELNLVEGKIILTKSFYKKVSDCTSEEYRILVQLRKDFADFAIEIKELKKKDNKKSYKGLSIDEMKRFMLTRNEKEYEKFKRVCDIAESQKGKYAIIKKWFLDNYKDEYVTEIETIKIEKSDANNAEESADTEKSADVKKVA